MKKHRKMFLSISSADTYRGKNFTLIELLIVIAIIAILAAMLFPVISTAKETVRTITCVNNQKQIMLMVNNYANDYNGYLVPNRYDLRKVQSDGGSNVSGMILLLDNARMIPPGLVWSGNARVDGLIPTLFCPSFRYRNGHPQGGGLNPTLTGKLDIQGHIRQYFRDILPSYTLRPGGTMVNGKNAGGYVYDGILFNHFAHSSSLYTTKVKHASRKAYVTEFIPAGIIGSNDYIPGSYSKAGTLIGHGWYSGFGWNEDVRRGRHNRKVVVGYLDGHAGTSDSEELYTNRKNYGNRAEWNSAENRSKFILGDIYH